MPQRHLHCLLIILLCVLGTITSSVTSIFDYGDALSKSLLYFEAQRSGRLPYNQRVSWRHHSALTDGLQQGVCTTNESQIKSVFYIFVFQILKPKFK